MNDFYDDSECTDCGSSGYKCLCDTQPARPQATIEEISGTILKILEQCKGANASLPRGILLNVLNTRLMENQTRSSDRKMREAIQHLRTTEKGKRIARKTETPFGYFWAVEDEELTPFIYQDYRRAWTTINRCNMQLKNAGVGIDPKIQAEINSQMELFPEFFGD